MIATIFFLIVATVINIIIFILQPLSFQLPGVIETALTEFISYGSYFNGLLPLTKNTSATGLWGTVGIIDIFSWVVTIIIALYIYKIAVAVLRKMMFWHKGSH